MSSGVPVRQLLATLAAERLVDADQAARGQALLETWGAIQPWYVRAMVGFGAWLASLMLVGFVASAGFMADGAHAVMGAGLAVASVVLRRRSENDFTVQSALAISLAGQLMFVLGIGQLLDWDREQPVVIAMFAMAVIMFVVFPDRLHRVLMVLIASGSIVTLTYLWKLNAIVPVLGPVFAAALLATYLSQGAWYRAGRGELMRPLAIGLMLSAFGCLLLSTVYVLPVLHLDFRFYPRPWVSTLLLGGLLVYTARDAWCDLLAATTLTGRVLVHAVLLLIVVSAWAAPGLLLALVVALLGARDGNRVVAASGVGFMAVFVTAYFYGIETTLLAKSMTLIGAGLVVLLARRVLLPALLGTAAGGERNA